MTPESPSWPHLLEQLLRGEAMTAPQATQLMQAWLAEELTPVQTGAFLAGLRAKPPVADELAAMAAGEVVSLPPEVARHTRGQVGSETAGWFSFQPLFEMISAREPELLG